MCYNGRRKIETEQDTPNYGGNCPLTGMPDRPGRRGCASYHRRVHSSRNVQTNHGYDERRTDSLVAWLSRLQIYISVMIERTSVSRTGTSLITIPQTIWGDTLAYPWMRRLRKAMMRRMLGIRLDHTGFEPRAWFNASPMISDYRSTADWSISSFRKSSRLRSIMNFWIRSQAFSTSKSSFVRARGSIQRYLAFFHRFFEIWILYCLALHEVYRRMKKLFELFHQAEVVLCIFHRRHGLELHKKIEISYLGQRGFLSGRAEKIQSLHPQGLANRYDFPTQIENFLNHDVKSYQKPYPLQTAIHDLSGYGHQLAAGRIPCLA